MPKFLSVYITATSSEEANNIALALVEERLVACANIFPGVWSIYRWEGKIKHADEFAIIAKTTADKFEALQKRVKELHSDKCPCIVASEIVAGNEGYLEWVKKG